MAAEFINREPLALDMQTKVKCRCGAEIDISGVTPRLNGIDVYCKVCGSVTNHKIVSNRIFLPFSR